MSKTPALRCFVISAAVLSFVAGCGKGKECGEMAKTINVHVAKLKAVPEPKDDNPEALQKSLGEIGTLAEAAAADVGKLAPKTPELAKMAQDYTALTKDVSKASKDAAGAIVTMAALEPKLEAQQKTLEKALEKMNGACEAAANAKDCLAISEKLKAIPQGDDLAKVAPAMATFSDEFGKLTAKAASVKAALADLQGAVKGQTALVKQVADAQAKATASETLMKGAEKKEDEVVDALNKFCGAA